VTTFLAILSALPKILAIIQFFMAKANDAEQRGLGRKEAIAEALEAGHMELAWADAATQEAREHQAAHPNSDDGRDTQFRRD
jgi:hypothetical protein